LLIYFAGAAASHLVLQKPRDGWVPESELPWLWTTIKMQPLSIVRTFPKPTLSQEV
jgi:hypothetical protein